MNWLGIAVGIVFFLAFAYAIFCSTPCDCVDLRSWNEMDELDDRGRELMARPFI